MQKVEEKFKCRKNRKLRSTPAQMQDINERISLANKLSPVNSTENEDHYWTEKDGKLLNSGTFFLIPDQWS